jgi:hypothetical protein
MYSNISTKGSRAGAYAPPTKTNQSIKNIKTLSFYHYD